MALSRIADSAERFVYRIAGLPVAVWAIFAGSDSESTDPLQTAFVWRYWHPDDLGEWSQLLSAVIAWPIAILLASAWYTWRNGGIIRRRHGKGRSLQFLEQLRLYFSVGVLAPWYYVFSLHDDGASRAPTFIQRFETKRYYFPLLKPQKGTPLNDKGRFADYCNEHGIRCVETLMCLQGEDPHRALPERDLFVKPTKGRGGRGTERWDHVGPSRFTGPNGKQLDGGDLLARLVRRSRREPLIIQPRLNAHPGLVSLTAGALPTIRILTCLNEKHEPEVMAAMLRTSFGKNITVDNLHAGGIGALVDLELGALSQSSNIGSDARLGWFSVHPDTHAPIEGRIVPRWGQVKAQAIAAHRWFDDRVVVGWDIAVLENGPIFIEGNGNPDLDILQRFMRIGLREHRFAELLAHHIRSRGSEGRQS
ncbi:MAG: sugar-transfer associated ATP-grasp domain-containing protein [Sphingomicrobium sp.]